MEIAEARLSDAEQSLNEEIYSAVVVLAYTAMFHAARALLFRDGFVEKSHVCVIAYLREKYLGTGKLEQKYITILNNAGFERHEVLYGLEASETSEDAEFLLQNAEEFVDAVRKLI